MGDNLKSDNKIKSIIKNNPTHRFKSYTAVIILVLLVFCFIVMVGSIGPDMFGLVIFSIIIALPVIILFRHKFVSILPEVISNNLLEIDHELDKERNLKAQLKAKFTVSKLVKEVAVYIIIVLLILGGCLLLKTSHDELEEGKTIIKILGAFLCFAIGGIMVLDMDMITYKSDTYSVSQDIG